MHVMLKVKKMINIESIVFMCFILVSFYCKIFYLSLYQQYFKIYIIYMEIVTVQIGYIK